MKRYDGGIKEALTEMLDEAPPSSIGKDETWTLIQRQMKSSQPDRKPRKKTIYIAASVIILACAVFTSSPQHASASFGWLSSLFVRIEGTLTQIMGTTASQDKEIKQAPVPAVNITGDEIRLEKLTVEEARSITTFGIVIPKHLPDGYNFFGVFVQTEGDKKSSHILIKYIKGDRETLEIRETDVNVQRGYSIGIDNDDTDIVDIGMPDVEGSILTFKNGAKKVVINLQGIQLVIDSNLSDKELREIVNSL